jgi:hypothetical protein
MMHEIQVSFAHSPIQNESWRIRRQMTVLRAGLRALSLAATTMQDTIFHGFLTCEVTSQIGGNVTTASYIFREGVEESLLIRFSQYLSSPKFTVRLLTRENAVGECTNA